MQGETISHYQILEELGVGGMGVVYKARDLRLERLVALKFLPVQLTLQPTAKERFLQEARAASALDHPNVGTVYEVDETADGRSFIAMAYYAGETLRQKIARGPLPASEALKIAAQVARGLAAAHRAGIIHRDIKPANIVVPEHGEAKLLDFGLAKLAGEARHLTRSGMTIGTAGYMSPEQARGEEVDARTDLWSLGVVLYEMLAGRLPFRGQQEASLLYAIVNEAPRALELDRPDVDPGIRRTVARLLAKDLGSRFRSADEVVATLEAVVRGEAGPPTAATNWPTKMSWRRPRAAAKGLSVAGLAAIAIAVAVGGWALAGRLRGSRPPAPSAKTLAVLPFSNLTGDPARDYFCEGMSSVLIHQLSALPGLAVAGRAETWAYKGQDKSAREIGKELGIGVLLEGQVLRVGEELRLQANLLDAASGMVRWSKSLSGKAEELVAMTERLAPEIAKQLAIELDEGTRARLAQRPTQDSAAYDSYLRAIQLLDQVDNSQRFGLAASLWREALERDPAFALAHAGLAETLAMDYDDSRRDPKLLDDALAHARRALELDPRLAEARIAMAHVDRLLGRSTEAIEELQRLVAAQPRNDSALVQLSMAFRLAGDPSQAESSLRRALAIRPDYWWNWNALGSLLMSVGDQEAAHHAFEQAQALAPPDVSWPQQNLGALAISRGDFAAAAAAFDKVPRPINDAGLATNIGTACFYVDRMDEAEEMYRLAVRLSPKNSLFRRNLADLLLHNGEQEAARREYREGARLLEERLRIDPTSEALALARMLYLAKAGDCADLRRAAAELAARLSPTAENAHKLALAYAVCGDRANALAAIEQALKRGVSAKLLRQEDELKALWGDPEFERLTRTAR